MCKSCCANGKSNRTSVSNLGGFGLILGQTWGRGCRLAVAWRAAFWGPTSSLSESALVPSFWILFGNIFRPILGTILGSGVGKVSACCSQKLSNETKIEKKCVSRCF